MTTARRFRYPHWLLDKKWSFGVEDDFDWYTSGQKWTTTAPDSGTATVGDAAGGVITLAPSDGTVADNDEIYLASTNEIFLFAAEKPLYAELLLQFTEANTDDANVLFGFMDAVGANALLDNGGGPKASYSGAVFYKVDGGTTWQVESSIATTQTTTDSGVTAGGSAYQVLGIECIPETSTEIGVIFYVDGEEVKDSNNRRLKHVITLGTATEMQLVVGAKNGDTNNENILVDYMAGWQHR